MQSVVVIRTTSLPVSVISALPQGIILGPLMFCIMYINDIANGVPCIFLAIKSEND